MGWREGEGRRKDGRKDREEIPFSYNFKSLLSREFHQIVISKLFLKFVQKYR